MKVVIKYKINSNVVIPPIKGTQIGTANPWCSLFEYFIFNNAKLINMKIIKVIKLVIFAKLSSGKINANNNIKPVTIIIATNGVCVVAFIAPIFSGNQCFLLIPYNTREAIIT